MSLRANARRAFQAGDTFQVVVAADEVRRTTHNIRDMVRRDANLRTRQLSFATQPLHTGETRVTATLGATDPRIAAAPNRSARRAATRSVAAAAPQGRQFGVELEITGLSLQRAAQVVAATGVRCESQSYNHRTQTFWKVVPDGSLSRGCEVVSPPLRGEAGLRELQTVETTLDVDREVTSKELLHGLALAGLLAFEVTA